ncbi:hypothetical protein J7F03_34970 [Streptomyces sp. ISL-43]|nr:hypothetical protein [Streptomyces sp. ISL-43]
MPDLPKGPLRTFNRELHALHGKAGYPSARRLYLAVERVVSHTKIHHAFTKPLLPSWGVVDVVVEQLAISARPRLDADAETDRFKSLWDEAHDSRLPSDTDVPSLPDGQGSAPVAGQIPELFRSRSVINPNRLIWDALVDLHGAGKPTSVPHVAAELERRGQLELCGGEGYLYECVKMTIKGAYEAGMSVHDFGLMNARKVRTAADARNELMAALLDPNSDADRVRKAHDQVTELHPHLLRPQQA